MKVSEMMTVLRERYVDSIEPESDSQPFVLFQWLNQAYLRIQRQSQYWSFLHSRGLLFSSVAGTASYDLTYRYIDQSTTYAIKDGTINRVPLYKGDYRFWVEEERSSAVTPGQPSYLIDAPGDSWILYPTPSAVWHVYGDAWDNPDTFDNEDSEPIWDAEFHDLVWLVALSTGIPRTMEKQFAESAVVEAQSNIPSIMQEFTRRYLSEFRGMRAA